MKLKKILFTSIAFVRRLPKTLFHFFSFFILLIFFLFGKTITASTKMPLIGKFFSSLINLIKTKTDPIYLGLVNKIEGTRTSEMKRSYMINLAYRSLMLKKTRSFITIAGMSFGVGVIVLLLSFGYGVERLIISKVAGLDELKMADISAGESTSVRLSREMYKKITKIPEVEKVLPLASVVGRVSYNRATTDVVVYAVTRTYLDAIKVKLKTGNLFSQKESYDDPVMGKVAGESTELKMAKTGDRISDSDRIDFNIFPDARATVWEKCSVDSKLLGYTTRLEGGYQGKDYWGDDYSPFTPYGRAAYDKENGTYLGEWMKAKLPLFTETLEKNDLRPILDEYGKQVWQEACVQKKYIQILGRYSFGQVLGEATASAGIDSVASDSAGIDSTATESASLAYEGNVVSTSSAGIEIVELQSSSASAATVTKKKAQETLTFQQKPSYKTVVSLGMINLLGINEKKAVGTKFKVSYIITKSLIPEISGRALTSEEEYEIVGVVDDADNQYFYIPLSDLQKVGLKFFTQLKVLLRSKDKLETVRKTIQNMGFRAASTQDTVRQIESLFANLRLVLGLLGMVALGVASLGMFNTLTVSLLERTREIGGMKTMGMISQEVQDLFLAEAMIMGLSGGVGGLLLGYAVGEIISILVSIWAVANGQGFLKLTYIPPSLMFFIIISSFVVGLVTGLYPAQRAKKTSALNALRYE